MSYTKEILKELKHNNPNEVEFLSAAQEVLQSLSIVVDNHKEYQKQSILERIVQPDRIVSFRVTWLNDSGKIEVNKGYRVQFNNAIGPYKGGLRFHPTVNQSILKFLGFEQIFKNSLTGLPIGGGKGGSDFDPKGKSDREVLNFCNQFMLQLHKHIGSHIDVPAGDIGVGAREIGYLVGAYKRLTHTYDGSITGKGLEYGGSLVRKEATGYGLVYIVQEILKDKNDGLEDKKIVISGSGNVAIYAAQKAIENGGIVIAMSDSLGWIFDKSGINLDVVKNIKEINRGRISEYIKFVPTAEYHTLGTIWDIPCDIALPCATQNEVSLANARTLVKNGVKVIAEGANMPTTSDAFAYLQKNGVDFLPGKAANSGGVATSAFEMSQNSIGQSWSFEQVDKMLQSTMREIYRNIKNTMAQYNLGKDFVAGANILGFEKVAKAMIAQGI